MNPGAAAFLIFFIIVSAFAGLGYLVPEMKRLAEVNLALHGENVQLQAEAVTNQQTIQAQQKALEQAHTKIQELESFVQTERAAKEEAYLQTQTLQQTHAQAQQQIAALQAELGAMRDSSSVEVASPKPYIAPTVPENVLPWLPPVLLLALAGGYGFHRFRFGRSHLLSDEERPGAGLLQSPETAAEPPADSVKVFVPRDRIPEFVRWLRQG